MEIKRFNLLLFDKTIGIRTLSNYYYYYDDDDDVRFQYFPPFYDNGKLNHFYPTDALLTFLMCEYELKKIKILGRKFYAVLTREGEIIYQYTRPDSFFLNFRFDDEDESYFYLIDGFSTRVLYKTHGMKKPKILELYEINPIFINKMKELLKKEEIIRRPYREDYIIIYI
ncbi:MAG: hypothetical protein RQ930_03300 [Candidatus Aenigmarchaeota archaeon]|nr:hypothetical protein [Candidatus Aenigmarchaeota archaeon]